MSGQVHAAHAASGTLVVAVLLIGLLAAYLAAARATRAAGGRWSTWRSASFAAGVLLLGVAVSPPVSGFAHESLRGHMVQHLLLGMFAPLALVLGMPGALFLRTVPNRAARGTVRLLGLRPVRCLIHPATAAVLDMGGMYLLYLTPLYALSAHDPVVHALVHVHFLVSGYLFTWSIAGADPAPHRPSMNVRLAVLVIASGAHATLAKLMYAYGFPRGSGHGEAEVEAAAKLMYYGGDVAELLLAVMFFAAWFARRRTQKALDRRAPLRLPGPLAAEHPAAGLIVGRSRR